LIQDFVRPRGGNGAGLPVARDGNKIKNQSR
jgi:hypothetical protein